MKLKINNLSKSYEEKEVLKDINISFDSGKIYGLLGRNGSGKTTFFNCINQDIDINDGLFYLTSDKKEKLDTKDIGYVTATPVVPEFLTGREFVQFYLDINKDKIDDIKDINYYYTIIYCFNKNRVEIDNVKDKKIFENIFNYKGGFKKYEVEIEVIN